MPGAVGRNTGVVAAPMLWRRRRSFRQRQLVEHRLRHRRRLSRRPGIGTDGRPQLRPAEMTSASKVALIGDTVARQLFADANPVGQTIRIKKVLLFG